MKTHRLPIAIAVSVGIHLAAYSIWQQRSQAVEISTEQPGQNFNIALINVQTKANPVNQTSPAKHQVKPKQAKIKTGVKNKKTSPPKFKTHKNTRQSALKTNTPLRQPPFIEEAVQHQPTKPSPPTAVAQHKPFSLLNNDMVKELNSKFSARFQYPMLARKRGWQGKVVLALNINRYGEIAKIVVQKSSGYKILDHNAIETFEAIGVVSAEIQTHIKQPHRLSIPIIYQLTGS